MKIISLTAENIKRLVAVEITPKGNMVEITGKNGAGKTSILDAIWWALEGTSHIQAEPIRKGATEALIKLDLGKLKVTRTFRRREDGGVATSIRVESEEGARFPSPQAVLDALVGELSFDPLAFTRMKPAEQYDALKRMVPDFDFDENARARRAAFDERTDANREAKRLRAQVDAYEVPDGLPDDLIDKREIMAELEAVHAENAALERRRANLDTARNTLGARQQTLDSRLARIKALRHEIAALEEEVASDRRAMESLESTINDLGDIPAPRDTSEIKQRLEKADWTNLQLGRRRDREQLAARAEAEEKRSAELTGQIDMLDKAKAEAVGAAKLPVPGLSFGDAGILLNGVPFDQGSDAEQLRASIAIAGAMNPKLRVIRVRDGSLLDDEAMKLLADYAEEHDLQVWIERVDSSGAVGFVIENGMLKAAMVAAE